jgi:hypothetical protein
VLHTIDTTKLETILPQLQNVEELRIGKSAIWYEDKFDSDRRSIRLFAVPIYPPEILTRLEAPLLEHLWVDGSPVYDGEYYSRTSIKELSFFFRHWSCHIR